MRKKIVILLLVTIVIITTIILISINNSDKYNTYTCIQTTDVVNGNLDTTYKIKYQEDKIIKIEYILKYYGKTEKDKENIYTLANIVKEEANQYSSKEGFTYRINRQTPTEFKITYYFEVLKLDTSREVKLLHLANIPNILQQLEKSILPVDISVQFPHS